MPAIPTRTQPEQHEFDFLMPYSERRPLLKPAEVATCLGRSVDFVQAMIDEGRLEVHAPQDREKRRYMITRRSVLLLLAEQAAYSPSYYMERLRAVLRTLTRYQLDELIIEATRLRARI